MGFSTWMARFPGTNIRKLASLGVLGMSVPEQYGGMGLPVFDTALILEEIAKVCYVTAMAVLGRGRCTDPGDRHLCPRM